MLWLVVLVVSKVKVKPGTKSVKLPFKTKVQQLDNITVEWNRSDPELMKVHVYQSDGVEQDDFYRGRTSMKEEPLKTGDLSLTLTDPCYRDSGTYICTVHRDGEILAQKVVRLQVKVPPEVVEYGEWDEYFTLPFKVQDELPEDATVEWKRTEPEIMTVHVYQEGKEQPDKQDEYFRGRTKMDDDPLKSKDLSVKISNPGYSDRGTYVCTVHRDGVILIQKKVLCRVKAPSEVVEVYEWDEYLTLPFKVQNQLPEDATVQWKRTKPIKMMVHVYQGGEHQPDKQAGYFRDRTWMARDPLKSKDLSVKIKYPGYSDRGIYVCTVYRDGIILMQKEVLCRVKGTDGGVNMRLMTCVTDQH
ncbi:uncharacterized protein LOC113744615 [Larimichthys crocea]|uniref:uncharacterized protein LOC113744615 n=1 Tax=Larimichthys crocea TaxID=215358 RepID=UPI000F5D5640|nr:uncharacterized protein LOC113744615 [Larimichthys crocea]